MSKVAKKVLRQKSVNVPIPLSNEDIELAEKMIYHIDDSQKEGSKFQAGVGVAAVQYGVLKRVFPILMLLKIWLMTKNMHWEMFFLTLLLLPNLNQKLHFHKVKAV
nr:peptide deformylase [Mycoplasmopsis bovis]